MCHSCGVDVVGLRELRENASELVRRVEEGEEITITVAGRPGARLVPATPRAWRRWDDVSELFAGPADPSWDAESEKIDHEVRDPWVAALKALLDSSVVIATDVVPLEGELAISAVTVAQLHFGVLVANQRNLRSERLRRLMILQRKFDALPLDEAVAASYGQLAAAVVDAGRRPRARSMDLLIAAPAHAHSARL
jgi:toxin FitB